jgi:hypothetical protein
VTASARRCHQDRHSPHVRAGEPGQLFEHFASGHHGAVSRPLSQLGYARGELYIFLQSGEPALGGMARRFGVDLPICAPADSLGVGKIGECDGFVLGVGEGGWSFAMHGFG